MENTLRQVPIRRISDRKNVFSRILPLLVFLSFIWLNLYTTLASTNGVRLIFVNVDITNAMLLSVIVQGFVDYIVFELVFFLYRFVIGFSIYSFMIPKQVLKDKFRFWYFLRNIVLGFLFNLRFAFPYLGTYLCIFELMFNFIFITCMYFDLRRNYVEPLVGQFVFKTLAVPVIAYEIYKVIVLMVAVL